MHLASLFANFPFEPALLIPLLAICGAILIVFLAMYFAHERRRLWHDTARIALEKGQPLPTGLQESDHNRRPCGPRRDLRSGLILVAVSVGLYLGMHGLGHGPQLLGSYITGAIGVVLLLNALIGFLLDRKDSSRDSALPPQS